MTHSCEDEIQHIPVVKHASGSEALPMGRILSATRRAIERKTTPMVSDDFKPYHATIKGS
jgi:hypothetical protein